MKYRCKQCGKVHESKPVICACGCFEFETYNPFITSPDSDVYKDDSEDNHE